ncbi:LLM class F420-dependent oxidoreductase [Ruicaihuangia caeni]|uniref:LLM class F420-dependent oxidoreductase n=1 Tax=Ruicaihuangia caeni TaxID=3042517 RepID=A0AAW6TDQ9_9MICO|nr:LLM class F420-dependent oxidoreductase [Klugiella sp. YN-L-19]MDI2099540.1 LLM class F420-dependent oxidoreductase [Klugiella sp. YN-L-19]
MREAEDGAALTDATNSGGADVAPPHRDARTHSESTATTPVPLGRWGVWRTSHADTPPEFVRGLEELGFGTLWIGGSPGAGLEDVERALEATERLTIATGVVNIWSSPAERVAESFQRIETRFPGRFVLGIGAGHPETTGEYHTPYQAIVAYLDRLDELGIPKHRRMLAALGPRMLRLAGERSAGAHPYFTTPEHTRFARQQLGAGPLLAPEHKIVISADAEGARSIARPAVERYLALDNYRANLVRTGFDERSLEHGGTDEIVDALALQGDPASVAARLRKHFDAGADHVAVQPLPMRSEPASALAALEALAPQLGP